jgi:Putative alpha-1,2-mannosidase
MKRILSTFFVILVSIGLISAKEKNKDFTKYVNPFIGTDFTGHTFPGATYPFGMIQLSPDTGLKGWEVCSGISLFT